MKKGVQKIYSEVAHSYEWVNHVLTLGMDVIWRKKGAKIASQVRGKHWLDVCSGTGDMTASLNRVKPQDTLIVSLDFSQEMIQRSKQRNREPGNHFTLADARNMPFPDNTFDLITISFATRNIDSNKDRLLTYLREFHRVLKPGGIFINLETSQPRSRIWKKLFHFYVRVFVHRIGYLISGSSSGYAYLAFTIPRFYCADDLASLISEAGFSGVGFKSMLFGIAAIHTGQKENPVIPVSTR